jgi:hypothetical protein
VWVCTMGTCLSGAHLWGQLAMFCFEWEGDLSLEKNYVVMCHIACLVATVPAAMISFLENPENIPDTSI